MSAAPSGLREALERTKAATLGGPLVEGMKPLIERDVADSIIRDLARALAAPVPVAVGEDGWAECSKCSWRVSGAASMLQAAAWLGEHTHSSHGRRSDLDVAVLFDALRSAGYRDIEGEDAATIADHYEAALAATPEPTAAPVGAGLRDAAESAIRLAEVIEHSADVEQAGLQAAVVVETLRDALRAAPVGEQGLDVAWKEAVLAVVDACDTELEGGAADDFERGADAAYNWVLSVIEGDVLRAARARLRTPEGGGS